jgi:hypothetical protein
MDLGHSLLLLWTAVIFYTLGVTWFAQLVVYPLFARVGEREYVDYHNFYSSRIPLPVILPGFARASCRLRSSLLALSRCRCGSTWRMRRAGRPVSSSRSPSRYRATPDSSRGASRRVSSESSSASTGRARFPSPAQPS